MDINLLELFLVKIIMILMVISIPIYGFIMTKAKKRLKFLETELKSREEIIDKIVKLDPEMEEYREILLTKNLIELNKIHQELKGN